MRKKVIRFINKLMRQYLKKIFSNIFKNFDLEDIIKVVVFNRAQKDYILNHVIKRLLMTI